MLKVVRGELGSGKLYVDCIVDGVKENCFVDTGASYCAVTNSERFRDYPVIGKFRIKSAAGVPKEVDQIRIGCFGIDSALPESREGLDVARVDPAEGFESVLGMPALAQLPFSFLFRPEPVFTVGASAAPPAGSALKGLKIHSKSLFSVPFRLGDEVTQGLWDTGAGLTSIDEKHVASHPGDFTYLQDIDDGSDANRQQSEDEALQSQKTGRRKTRL